MVGLPLDPSDDQPQDNRTIPSSSWYCRERAFEFGLQNASKDVFRVPPTFIQGLQLGLQPRRGIEVAKLFWLTQYL